MRRSPSRGDLPPLPLGPGVAARELSLDEGALRTLGHVLSGYDGLASLHGDGVRVVAVTTSSQASALDALLDELAREGTVRFSYRPVEVDTNDAEADSLASTAARSEPATS